MAVTHPTTVRNILADTVVDRLDLGPAAGTLHMRSAGDIVLAQLTFSDPAFGVSSGGIAVASAIASSSNLTSAGTIANAILQDSSNNLACSCSVTATDGGGDIELNSVVVSKLQEVSLSSLTYTAPP